MSAGRKNPSFDVRRAKPADADDVTALLEASYPALMGNSYDTALMTAVLPLITQAQPTLLASGRFFVADAGSLAGCGGWSEEKPGSSETVDGIAHVRHFGVHPDWTRRGVGSAILKRCLEDARLVNIQRFECYASINGERFYAALGFRRVRPINVELSGGLQLPSILMRLDL